MKLRFERDYMAFRAGNVYEVDQGLAEILVRRTYAVQVEPVAVRREQTAQHATAQRGEQRGDKWRGRTNGNTR